MSAPDRGALGAAHRPVPAAGERGWAGTAAGVAGAWRSRRALRLAAAIVVAAVLLGLILREVSLRRVGALVLHAPLPLLLLAGIAALVFNVLRGLRYHLLLRGDAGGPGLVAVTAASTTAWGVSLALPGILGDAFLVWLLRRRGGVPMVRTAGAVILCRGADVISLAATALLTAWIAGVRLPVAAMLTAFALGIALLAVVAALMWRPARALVLAQVGRLPYLGRLAANVDAELDTMSGPAQVSGLVLVTAAARLCSAVEYSALFASIGFSLNLAQTLFTVSTRTLLYALPVQGVAGLGTTQLWWTAGLVLLGWRAPVALAGSLSVHVLDLAVSLPVAGLGVALLVTGTADRARSPLRSLREALSLRAGEVALKALVLIGGAVLLFWNLGQGSLFDWDEATYAEIAREIGVFHSWVFLHWNYVAWFNKAPLYIWLTGLVFRVDAGEWGARAVSAAAGTGLFLLTYNFGYRLYGRVAGILAAAILALCYQFLAAARFGTSDTLLTLWIYLMLYAYVRADSGRSRWWYLVGVAGGLALMTKDFAALVAPGAIVVAIVLDRRVRANLRRREPWIAVAIALVIALPWHLASYLHYGSAFVSQYFGYMVLSRATNQIEGHTGTALTYPILIRNQFYPWAYVLVPAGIAAVVDMVRARRRQSIVLVFPVMVLALYTLVQSKLVWYMLPIYPAAAMLVAAFVLDAFKGSRWRLAALGLALVAAFVSVPRSLPPLPPALVVGGVAALILLPLLAWWRRPAVSSTAAVAVVVGVACLGAASVPHIARLYDMRESSAETISRVIPRSPSTELVFYVDEPAKLADYNVSHALLYYSHRPLAVVVGRGDLDARLATGVDIELVMPAAEVHRVRGSVTLHVLKRAGNLVYGTARLTRAAG